MEKNIYPFYIFIIGTLVGSFINVCIYRIPKDISIVYPRSFCSKCKKRLQWWQIIPLLSFIFLKGKCYYCNQKISWEYPIVEIISAIMAILLFYRFNDPTTYLFYLALSFALLTISMIDVKYYRIPNKILLFLLIAGLTINLLYNIIAWDMAFLGMFGSGAFLFLLRFVGNRMLKKETLGMGDVKLGTVVGFYLGFTDFLTALLTGSLLAIIISVLLTHSPAKMIKARIPLAPYLTIGVLLVLLFS